MTRRDTVLRVLIVVGVLYSALLVVMIIFFALSIKALSGLRVTYENPYNDTTQIVNQEVPVMGEKTRRELILQGSQFYLGKDLIFSAEFDDNVVISDDSVLGGGGGYVGLKVLGDNLDIRFGLPYEATDLRYKEKVKVFSSLELGDVFRVRTSDNYVFYTNIFRPFIVSLSYCSTDSGTSEECASPVLNSSNNDTETSKAFIVSCNINTPQGLEKCDEVVKTIIFE